MPIAGAMGAAACLKTTVRALLGRLEKHPTPVSTHTMDFVVDYELYNDASQNAPLQGGQDKPLDHFLPRGVRTWEQEVFVEHSEIPQDRNCQSLAQPLCLNSRKCVTCSALRSMQHADSCIKLQEAVQAYYSLMPKAAPASPMELIKHVAVTLATLPDLRKKLSHMGAVRIQKDHAIRAVNNQESMNDYFIYIVKKEENTKDGQTKTLKGFVFYKDLGNSIYSEYLNTLKVPETLWMSAENKGDIIETLLAMGWVYTCMERAWKDGHEIFKEVCLTIENGLVQYVHGLKEDNYQWKTLVVPTAYPNDPMQGMGGAAASAQGHPGTKALEGMKDIQQRLDAIVEVQKELRVAMERIAKAQWENQEAVKKQIVDTTGGLEKVVGGIMEELQRVSKEVHDVRAANFVTPDDHEDLNDDDKKAIDWLKANKWRPMNPDGLKAARQKVESGAAMERRFVDIQNKIYSFIANSKEAYHGWVAAGLVLDHIRSPTVHGELSEEDFWFIIYGTYNKTHKEKSSYLVHAAEDAHTAVKIRKIQDGDGDGQGAKRQANDGNWGWGKKNKWGN